MTLAPIDSSTLTTRQRRMLQSILLGKYMAFLVSVRDLSERRRAECYARWLAEPAVIALTRVLTEYDRAHEAFIPVEARVISEREFQTVTRYNRRDGLRSVRRAGI